MNNGMMVISFLKFFARVNLRPNEVPDIVFFADNLATQFVMDLRAHKLTPKNDRHSSTLSWMPAMTVRPISPIAVMTNRGRQLWSSRPEPTSVSHLPGTKATSGPDVIDIWGLYVAPLFQRLLLPLLVLISSFILYWFIRGASAIRFRVSRALPSSSVRPMGDTASNTDISGTWDGTT
jgi:hypothetical protein